MMYVYFTVWINWNVIRTKFHKQEAIQGHSTSRFHCITQVYEEQKFKYRIENVRKQWNWRHLAKCFSVKILKNKEKQNRNTKRWNTHMSKMNTNLFAEHKTDVIHYPHTILPVRSWCKCNKTKHKQEKKKLFFTFGWMMRFVQQ